MIKHFRIFFLNSVKSSFIVNQKNDEMWLHFFNHIIVDYIIFFEMVLLLISK